MCSSDIFLSAAFSFLTISMTDPHSHNWKIDDSLYCLNHERLFQCDFFNKAASSNLLSLFIHLCDVNVTHVEEFCLRFYVIQWMKRQTYLKNKPNFFYSFRLFTEHAVEVNQIRMRGEVP